MNMSKGFAPILIILLVAVLGIGGYFAYTSLRGGVADEAIFPTKTPQPSPNPADETANWKTYKNVYYSIRYPLDYEYKDLTNLLPKDNVQEYISYVSVSDEYVTAPNLLASQVFDAPKFSPIITVKKTGEKTLQQIVDKVLQSLKDGDYVLKSKQQSKVDNVDSVLIVSNTEYEDPKPSYFTYYFIKDQKLYTFFYTSLDESSIPIFNQILSTFKFTNNQYVANNSDICNFIDGAKFTSVDEHEVGLGPHGSVMGHWGITFGKVDPSLPDLKIKFESFQSDYSLSGTYTCKNGIFNAEYSNGFPIQVNYDNQQKLLNWNGVKYKKIE